MRLFSKHVIIEGSLERKAFEMSHSKENGGKVYNVLVRMGSCNVAGNFVVSGSRLSKGQTSKGGVWWCMN